MVIKGQTFATFLLLQMIGTHTKMNHFFKHATVADLIIHSTTNVVLVIVKVMKPRNVEQLPK